MNVIFNKDNFSLTIQAQADDMFSEVCFKYMQKIGINDGSNLSFFYNTIKIPYDSFKSLSELNIPNGGIINVLSGNVPNFGNFGNFGNNANFGNFGNYGNQQFGGNAGNNAIEYLNVSFIVSSRIVNVQGQSDMQFCDLVKKFINKAALDPQDQPKYVINAVQIPPNSTQTLKALKIGNFSKVTVFLEKQIVGA